MDPLPELDDPTLWDRVRNGHEHSFDALFVRHHDPIYNYCFRRTANWSVAEDLTSATFFELWRGRSRFVIRSASALPLLYGIAANLLRNERRSLKNYEKAAVRLGNEAAAQQSVAELPEEQLAAVDIAEKALRALRRLRPTDRDILTLRIFGELSYAEIGEALSIPEGTVGSRLSRAQDRLSRDPLLSLQATVSPPAIRLGGGSPAR